MKYKIFLAISIIFSKGLGTFVTILATDGLVISVSLFDKRVQTYSQFLKRFITVLQKYNVICFSVWKMQLRKIDIKLGQPYCGCPEYYLFLSDLSLHLICCNSGICVNIVILFLNSVFYKICVCKYIQFIIHFFFWPTE